MPKLDALSQQPRYVMKLAQMEPGAARQWLPITGNCYETRAAGADLLAVLCCCP
ncbi:hypothetical protein DMI60_23040 [Escherichia coli]|nr:hypothetical protein [Escherichia coli]